MASKITLAAALFALAACAACGSSQPGANASNSAAAQNGAPQRPAQTVEVPPVSSAHGGATSSAPAGAPPQGAASADKPTLATPELDAKIEKAETKAKAAGASDADKKAAASAYVERANVYYSAGQPVLYKFALGDFRRALRYDPNNAEAREKMDQIVSIYQSMGRPVPSNGLDQQ